MSHKIHFVDLIAFALCASADVRCKRLTNTLLHYIACRCVSATLCLDQIDRAKEKADDDDDSDDGEADDDDSGGGCGGGDDDDALD